MKIFLFWKSWVWKTTIWRKLSEKLKVPFFELDKVFWDFENNISISDEQRRVIIINELLKENKTWIIEWLYRQDWLDLIIEESDYIFYIHKNNYLIDFQIINRFLKRIFKIEKSERESNIKLLFDFIKNNHSNRFENIYLKELKQRLLKLNKKIIEVKSIEGIYNITK